MRRLSILLPILLLAGAYQASTSAIADGLNVNWRQAKVVRLAKPATSVVIGDPTVADVTLDNPTTLVVFGKTPGETNIIVLSASSELLLDWPIVVGPVTAGHVSVVNAQGETAPQEVLYSCNSERCARVLSPSDVSFSASATSSTSNTSDASKDSNATSNSSGEVSTGGPVAPVPNP